MSGEYLSKAQKATTKAVADEVRDERHRQVKDLGFGADHDDTHPTVFMVDLTHDYLARARNDLASWPSDARVSEGRDNLVKAAALIVATIERLDREVATS